MFKPVFVLTVSISKREDGLLISGFMFALQDCQTILRWFFPPALFSVLPWNYFGIRCGSSKVKNRIIILQSIIIMKSHVCNSGSLLIQGVVKGVVLLLQSINLVDNIMLYCYNAVGPFWLPPHRTWPPNWSPLIVASSTLSPDVSPDPHKKINTQILNLTNQPYREASWDVLLLQVMLSPWQREGISQSKNTTWE